MIVLLELGEKRGVKARAQRLKENQNLIMMKVRMKNECLILLSIVS
jgi:hypothetical protein